MMDDPGDRKVTAQSLSGCRIVVPESRELDGYAPDADTARVSEVIEAMAAGRVDPVAFTSSPQLRRLGDVARDKGIGEALRAGLARTRIAAVGPVAAATIGALGASVAIMPDRNFHMKPLVNAICAAFDDDRRRSRGGC